MSVVAARQQPRRRSGRRLLIILLAIVVVVAGALFWLNQVAQAAVDASAVLTVYQPVTTVEPTGTKTFNTAASGALVHPGDSVMTDGQGRAALTLPDGSITRLAGNTQIKLDSAHFAKDGNLHDASWFQSIGRTLTHVQHLVSGASFQVAGQSAVASVRGTLFEVLVNADGSMTVKLFDGTLLFHGKNDVTLTAPEEATADPQGNIGPPTAIQPDPNDPFGPQVDAAKDAETDTTPGTEQDFVGAPLHDGDQQKYTYSYAGGSLVKAVLGYIGSSMSLTVAAPDGSVYPGSGKSPVEVDVKNAPPGIYTVTITGVSGLGTAGEEPFLAVASVEPCASADLDVNGAVHRGYSSSDLEGAVQVAGLSNLNLAITGGSTAGSIVTGTGTYNGVSWGGTIVLVNHGGVLMVIAISATVFGIHIPAGQILQQIGAAARQDPSTINPGFTVDRLFTCQHILVIDGHHG
jgi:FecR protein